MDDVDENTSMNDLQWLKVKQLKYFSRKQGLKVVKKIQRIKIKPGALDETFNLPLQNKLIYNITLKQDFNSKSVLRGLL